MYLDLAKAYGHKVGVGVLLILFLFVGFPYIAFSKDTKYVGPIAEGLDGLMPAEDRPLSTSK